MLPVALTCPLWWVARWATRVLTSFAVIAALAIGAATSPPGSPAPAAAASTLTVEPPVASDQPAVTDTRPARPTIDGTATRDSATRAACDSATVDSLAVRDSATVREAGSAWSADLPPALHGRPGDLPSAPTGVASVRATSDWSPRVDTSASRAPRAPPEQRSTPGG
ncbi:hypothetical protein OOJ91_29925 [Micromonospora lupini]|uniref:hypothetical protein n=1 Tax=Micromonospora lupini TaxID=285679 RepID=UPI00224E04AB|nr:hypothetical protein [Micromonospora lupini]MCX5070072.1 hypothetical protein [Micromonospora lupini]